MTDADLRQHSAYRLAIQDAAALVDRHMHGLVPDAQPAKANTAVQERR